MFLPKWQTLMLRQVYVPSSFLRRKASTQETLKVRHIVKICASVYGKATVPKVHHAANKQKVSSADWDSICGTQYITVPII